ncbi:MAG TPA: hypothetical protein VIU29_10245 [Candidatus Deferrimicrobiaceae bacterium]
MIRHPGIAVPLLFVAALFATPVFAAVNPHISMDACPACHTAIPSPEDVLVEEFRLTRPTIDETCRTCHPVTACALGLGLVVHPSGIRTWNTAVCNGPKSLPLYEGKIGCATCHFHLKPVGEDFKMVRNVTFLDGQPEFTRLCADCHEDYY